jgi:hypothetical protein
MNTVGGLGAKSVVISGSKKVALKINPHQSIYPL